MFHIVDEDHGDGTGVFVLLDAALGELKRLARTPWDAWPNRAPCMSWPSCGRWWVISEAPQASDASGPWRVVVTLAVSQAGTRWFVGPDATPSEVDAIGPRARRGRARRLALRAAHDSFDVAGSTGDSGPPEQHRQTRRAELNRKLRQVFVEGADEQSQRERGRGLTPSKLERVLKRYPGDLPER